MNEHLGIIFFYLSTKRFAIKKILDCHAPMDDDKQEDTQIAYGMYFNSIISIIEYTKEKIEGLKLNGQSLSILENDIISILGSDDNYGYLRELRNSIVHRGYNVLDKGTVYNDIVVPVSPLTRSSKNASKTYNCFTSNLFELVKMTEQINPFIHKYCQNHNLLGLTPVTKESILKDIQDIWYMPDETKKLAPKMELDIDELNKGLIEKYNNREKLYFDTSDLLK